MQNFTIIGFKSIIRNRLERKQLSLAITLDFYWRSQKPVTKAKICEQSSIERESFSRSLKRLQNNYDLIGNFNYDEKTKKINSSFKLYQSKELHLQVPTHLIRVGALTNSALAIFGYLKAMPKMKWDGSCYILHQKINRWFIKHNLDFSLSLTSVYKAIKLLETLKLINKVSNSSFKNKKWIWHIKISVNQETQNKSIGIEKIVKGLKKLKIKLFDNSVSTIKEQEIWSVFD